MTTRPGSTPVLLRNLFAGLTIGVLAGSVVGAESVAANRYLAAGYPQLALLSLRRSLNLYGFAAAGLFALITLTGLCFTAVPRLRHGALRAHGLNAVFWIFAGTAILLWRLRQSPSMPRASSMQGVLLFGAVVLTGAGASWLAVRQREPAGRGMHAVVRGLGGAGPAIVSLVLLAGVNAASAVALKSPRPRVNVLLITIDALRADHLGVYGYPRETSPNIDRLAREGARFGRAVSQWPLTSPSFASMMSSTYGHTNGLMRTTAQRMPDRLLTLAELLEAGGYSTWAAVGNVNLARSFNFDQGFDTYHELWREQDGQRTRRMTRDGLDLLRRASASRPFFLWLHYFDPHARYQPPEPYDGMFVNDGHFDASRRAPLHRRKRDDMGGIPASVSLGHEDRIAYYVAQYDAEIRFVDQQVGLLLQALDRSGLAGKTLVILTADHGESLGDHNYFFEHGRLPYDDCVHVPLILRGPGTGKPGAFVHAPVELIDLVPTVLDLAGLPPDPEAEGKSLRPLLEGSRSGGLRWAYAFSESGFAREYQRSITSERFKLVYVPDAGDRRIMQGRSLELYDLQKDPGETRNLVDARPEVTGVLKKQLARWIEDGGTGNDLPEEDGIDQVAEKELRSLGYLE